MRQRSTWGEVVALILRDCDTEVRLEFMRVLGQWKRMSLDTIEGEKSHPGDRDAAEERLVKLRTLEEHLEREMDLDAAMRQSINSILFRSGFGA
jgi:hypothetical protein